MNVTLQSVKGLQLLHEIPVLFRKYSLCIFYQERHSSCISLVTGENLDYIHTLSSHTKYP